MRLKRIVPVLLGTVITLGSTFSYPAGAYANTRLAYENNYKAGAKTIEVTKSDIKELGAGKAIQEALNTAKDNAKSGKPYKIKVPAGTYKLDRTLLIYSNTELFLNNVTLVAGKDKNVIHVGALDEDAKGATGYYYKNITIEGGTLDGKKKSGTIVKAGHVSNLSMKNVTVKNTHNAHLMEVAGVKGLKVTGCKFQNMVSDSKGITFNEAIQLDILYPKHMPGYRAETLNNENVVIDKCEFTNVPRGVGSHTAILNQGMDKIKITNCKFKSMASSAIQGLGWRNCTISNNKIEDSPRGIIYYEMVANGKGTFLPSALAKAGKTKTKLSDKYKAPSKNMNIVIKDNDITLNSKKDPSADYERVAILVSGVTIDKKVKNGDGSGNLPNGNYYASGVTVEGNSISTKGHGVRCVDAQNITITGNEILCNKASDNVGYNGIQAMVNSENIKVISNSIKNVVNNGIYFNRGSQAAEITGNIIDKTGKYGIDIEESNVGKISLNKVSNTGNRGIFVFSQSIVDIISENEVSDTTDVGIQVSNATAKEVTDNVITNPGRVGIMFSSGANGKKIINNIIEGYDTDAISINGGSDVDIVQDSDD